jgi:hypothetical protein
MIATVVISNVLLIACFYQAAQFMAPAATWLLSYGAVGLAAAAHKLVPRLRSAPGLSPSAGRATA